MGRRRPHAVATPALYPRHGVRSPGVASEKVVAGHLVRQTGNEVTFEFGGRDVGEIVYRHAGVLAHDPQPHEGARPHGSVIGAAHRVTLAGVDPPELDV